MNEQERLANESYILKCLPATCMVCGNLVEGYSASVLRDYGACYECATLDDQKGRSGIRTQVQDNDNR